jgi:hypothetical protein
MTTTTPTLPAINKLDFAHRIIQDGTGRTTKQPECWSARTRDGRYEFSRLDGVTGTPWSIVVVLTETEARELGTLKVELDWATSLRRCRLYVANGWAAEALAHIQEHQRGKHDAGRVPSCGRC